MKFATGIEPFLLSTILPPSVVISIAWAIIAVLVTLAVLRIKKGTDRKEH